MRSSSNNSGLMLPSAIASPPQAAWDKPYEVLLGDTEMQSVPLPHAVMAFTDGAGFGCKETRTMGSGVTIREGDVTLHEAAYHLKQQSGRVLQAQLFAIKKAAEWLYTHPAEEYIIYSDSMTALRGLAAPFFTSRLILEVSHLLANLSISAPTSVRYVKAQSGNQGNCRAHTLAKNGAQDAHDPALATEDEPSPTRHQLISLLRDRVGEVWEDVWSSSLDCRQTKHWFPGPDKSLSHSILKMDRVTFSTAVQILTGHNYLRRHNSLTAPDEFNPACRLCLEEEETSLHIVSQCPALASVRNQVFGGTSSSPSPLSGLLHRWSASSGRQRLTPCPSSRGRANFLLCFTGEGVMVPRLDSPSSSATVLAVLHINKQTMQTQTVA